MNCAACTNPIEKGKTVFCVRCFESLPHSERESLRKHYLRIRQVCRNPAQIEAGMRDKLRRCIAIIRAADVTRAAQSAAVELP